MTESRNAALQVILERRSVSRLDPEALPTAAELETLLRAAATVPDHGELRPYRFVVSQGDGRTQFAEALVRSGLEQNPELPPGAQDKLRRKAFAAPTQILLIASPREGMKIPEWEQVVTASCTGYAIALAAYALGLGAIWKSAPIMAGVALRDALELAAGERLLGWVNVGRPLEPIVPRAEPPVLARRLGAAGLTDL